MRCEPKWQLVGWIVVVVVLVSLVSAWGSPGVGNAQAESCGGAVEIVNGGFESPDLPPGGSRDVTPDGWTSAGSVVVWGEDSPPSSSTQFASVRRNASLSQAVHQPDLAGATVTITFAASGEPSSLIVRFGTHDRRFLVEPGFASYALSVPVSVGDLGPYILAFEGARPNAVDVDDVAVSYTKPCPTPTPTTTPTAEPPGEVEITVTGDPRYPVTGSAALDVPGLSYVLGKKPVEGTVVVSPDGSFVYTAASRWAMFDRFIVVASNNTVITVNVVLQIDPPVPSFRDAKPGSEPTPGPEKDSCARCD